ATNRRERKEAGDSIKRLLNPGVTELGNRLGPLLWQFAPTKKFDASDFGGFLELLPAKFDGQALRHVIEVRHDSFRNGEFIALLRKFDMPVVYARNRASALVRCRPRRSASYPRPIVFSLLFLDRSRPIWSVVFRRPIRGSPGQRPPCSV